MKEEYIPAYRSYDSRSNSERIREYATKLLLILIVLGAGWFLCSILSFMVTKDVALVYWPLTVVHFICKWATFIGWPIWLIIEVAGIIVRIDERRHGLL